ncbi:MAG: hypothetical protein Gaeavirus3_16 [Gaeavirus sp.]|uniref:Transmembrane protein n=1 Tax=Gaeavirus sp. TaxID=2487767 RepID=A0A3G4ZYI4_9VIRU|nr:MAG: hypothetical protein Gaeavirus3_16 [Gaeavirus sp.]
MDYTNPGFIYVILALLMLSAYYIIEFKKGSTGSGTIAVVVVWACVALILTSVICGIQASKEQGLATPQNTAIMYGLSIVTLIISSVCLSCA